MAENEIYILTKEEKDQLYIKYFGKLEEPAVILLQEDGKYISEATKTVIDPIDIPHLGMGVMIIQEDLNRGDWF